MATIDDEVQEVPAPILKKGIIAVRGIYVDTSRVSNPKVTHVVDRLRELFIDCHGDYSVYSDYSDHSEYGDYVNFYGDAAPSKC